MAGGGDADRHRGVDGGRIADGGEIRRLHAVRPGARGLDRGGRRRPQHPGRPDRAGVARTRRLLCHRRLHRGDPDTQGRELLDRVPARGRGRRHHRFRARAAGVARERALSRHAHHRLRLHRAAWHDRVARPDRRLQRSDGDRAALDRTAGLLRARDGDACRHARRPVALCVPPPGPERLGHGHDRGARCRGRGPRDRHQSGHRQDRGIFPLGDVHGTGGRNLRAAADVRGAELLPVLAVDPVSVRSRRGRRRLDLRARHRRAGQRRPAGDPVGPGRIPAAVLRCVAAGDPVGRARRRARHARPRLAASGSRRRRRPGVRRDGVSHSQGRRAGAARARHRHHLRRDQGCVRRHLQCRARQGDGRDRPQRRRQDHRAQPHRRLLPSRHRQHPARRCRACRRAGLAGGAGRDRTDLPDHQAVRDARA